MKRLVLAVAVLLVVPSSASASGVVTMKTGGRAASALKAAGVKVSGVGSASASGGGITLTVSSGTPEALKLGGGLALKKGGRTARLSSLTLSLSTSRPTLTAKLSGRRIALLQGAARRAKVSGSDLTLSGAKMSLTPDAAKALGRALGASLKSGGFARLDADATVRAGGVGVLARPGTAVDATSGAFRWHIRDSFVQYMNGGEGITASGDARPTGKSVQKGSDAALDYDFDFTFRDGWFDAASGQAAVRFTGVVKFSYKAHGINIVVRDPEIEVSGKRSRAIFTIGGKRSVLVNLKASAPVDGDFGPMPGTVPEDASDSVFAGYYLAGDPFGTYALAVR